MGTFLRVWPYAVTYILLMKQPEYIEGPKALENFERGMIALFKVPKTANGKARKKGRQLTTKPKRKHTDRDLKGTCVASLVPVVSWWSESVPLPVR